MSVCLIVHLVPSARVRQTAFLIFDSLYPHTVLLLLAGEVVLRSHSGIATRTRKVAQSATGMRVDAHTADGVLRVRTDIATRLTKRSAEFSKGDHDRFLIPWLEILGRGARSLTIFLLACKPC